MRRPRRNAALAGAFGVAAVLAALAFDPSETVDLLRERLYDRLLAIAPPRPAATRVVVLDINAAALARQGPWLWRRERIARLIEAARDAGAAAVCVDILFSAPDAQSPAALARRLAEASGDARALDFAKGAADDDMRLEQALRPGGVALSFALDPDGEAGAPTAPILVRSPPDLRDAWTGSGGVYPLPALAKAAALGLSSLRGDADGIVRRAPLFAIIGGSPQPGLALETLRLAQGASAYVLQEGQAKVGSLTLALPRDAMLRLAPGTQAIETVSAAAALAGFAAAAAVMGASRRQRTRRLREGFERRLAPAVIARIVADEDRPRLASERRDITALFTDIEGFTGMVGRAEPEALVSALDGYFEGLTRIGFAHGGMVDKFVGDAAHAFFSMPFDLADHPTKALDCAEEIVAWSEAYRRGPSPAALGFGRTRVGLVSGPALVGDVGGGAKLDYTALGETVSVAARLEQAGKIAGTAICAGPGAAARLAPGRLRPVGSLELRGFPAPVPAASPWPEGASPAWRARYLEAWARRETAPNEAAAMFAALAAELADPVAGREGQRRREPMCKT